ncbi:MAG: extensin family protein [Pseudolabrys sp.]
MAGRRRYWPRPGGRGSAAEAASVTLDRAPDISRGGGSRLQFRWRNQCAHGLRPAAANDSRYRSNAAPDRPGFLRRRGYGAARCRDAVRRCPHRPQTGAGPALHAYDDFECRGRNRVAGAKLSEHGKGNAVDLRSFVLADGRVLTLTDVTVAKDFRDELRDSACHRFTTVLGPGSDSSHESHIHLDLIERRGGYRMCQWDVRPPPITEVASRVPLPLPRPTIDRSPTDRKM